MGQKSNPIALRIGEKNNWKSISSKAKTKELANSLSVERQILSFASRFLRTQGFLIQDYRINNSGNQLCAFLSIYSTTKTVTPKTVKIKKYAEAQSYTIKSKTSRASLTKKIGFTEPKVIGRKSVDLTKVLTKSLTLLAPNKKIILDLSIANKQFNLINKSNKTQTRHSLLSLRRHKRQGYFTEGFNSLFAASRDPNFSLILTEFISNLVGSIKRVKPTLRFLKQALTILIGNQNYPTTGIKIKIQGRISGANRARSNTILVGSVPCHTRDTKLEYNKKSGSNHIGAYGIKVWVVSK